MDITLTLSAEQEAALTRSNTQTNPDPGVRPRLEAFVQSVFNQKAAEHVRAWAGQDDAALAQKLATSITTMTKEDKEAVVTILDKYQIKPPTEVKPPIVGEEPPIIEEPIAP